MQTISLQHHEQGIFDNAGCYISGMRLFYAHFKELPCVIKLKEIADKEAIEFIEANANENILFCYKKQIIRNNKKDTEDINFIYCTKENIIIDIEEKELNILYSLNKEAEAKRWANNFKEFLIKQISKRTTTEISLIRQTKHGYFTTEIEFKNPKLNLSKHYNDDLISIHQTIIKSLRQKNKSGIILLHGEPGTGKSTYIRYIIRQQKKKVVFISPKIINHIDSPDFTDFLIDHANTIFVIEEAEQLLVSRNTQYNSAISMLLNITDGILGDSLGIQIIATFNTSINNIDKALLRKGRLIALYEFKPLCIEKTIKLIEENNSNYEAKQPMTLADIYNIEETAFSYTDAKRNNIGFRAV
jgi:SpoVK/Ycf46/Vps4 family AAA+-type ATPase